MIRRNFYFILQKEAKESSIKLTLSFQIKLQLLLKKGYKILEHLTWQFILKIEKQIKSTPKDRVAIINQINSEFS